MASTSREPNQTKPDRSRPKKPARGEDRGQLTSEAILFLALLLGAPLCAFVKLSAVISPAYLVIYGLGISTITYFVYAWDKNRAQKKGQREPEQELHLLELLGGWPGAFIAQRSLRHKCSKLSYQIVFWLIVATHQFVSIDYLRHWSIMRGVLHGLKEFLA